jgi:hypothetical protein
LLFKKNTSIKERANAALASLQRNAYAMGMLRSRLESRITLTLNEKGNTNGCEELTRVLELVKNGELILHEMSEKIESFSFLEEFVTIMDSAASSVSMIKTDLEQMMPAAEAALEEMHDAISKISTGLQEELRKGMEPAILAEVTAAIAAGRSDKVSVTMKEEAQPPQNAKEEEKPEPVLA